MGVSGQSRTGNLLVKARLEPTLLGSQLVAPILFNFSVLMQLQNSPKVREQTCPYPEKVSMTVPPPGCNTHPTGVIASAL